MATIQGVYIALFGRPADPLGLAFFNEATNDGADLTAIGDLAATAEYQDRFEGMSNAQVVTAIYQSLFGRAPELAGLTFFVNALNNGDLNINNVAIAILDGAQGADADIVANKEAAASAYTAAIAENPDALAAYNGASGILAGTNFLSGITADAATVPTEAEVDAAVAALAGSGHIGDDFVFTAGVDTLVGTEGNDTFRGVLDTVANGGTINPLDTIDGGAGVDTLYIDVDDGAMNLPHSSAFKSIEIIQLDQFDALLAGGVDSAAFADAQEIWQINAFQNIEVGDAVLAGFKGGAAAVAAAVNVKDGVNEVSVALDGVVTGSAVAFTETTAGDLETVNVSGSVGGAAALTLTAVGTEETLNLAISSNSTVTIASFVAATTIDASASTGNLTLDTTGTAAETVLGGSGNDTITLVATTETVEAGAGADAVTLIAGAGTEIIINEGDSGLSLATVDSYTAFVTGDHEFNFGAGEGTADNFAYAGAFSGLADSLDFVNSGLAGSFGDAATDLTYIVTYDGTDSYLFVDADGDGAADSAVVLLGIDASAGAIVAGDIVA